MQHYLMKKYSIIGLHLPTREGKKLFQVNELIRILQVKRPIFMIVYLVLVLLYLVFEIFSSSSRKSKHMLL